VLQSLDRTVIQFDYENLEAAVGAGRSRRDLYYRINVIAVAGKDQVSLGLPQRKPDKVSKLRLQRRPTSMSRFRSMVETRSTRNSQAPSKFHRFSGALPERLSGRMGGQSDH